MARADSIRELIPTFSRLTLEACDSQGISSSRGGVESRHAPKSMKVPTSEVDLWRRPVATATTTAGSRCSARPARSISVMEILDQANRDGLSLGYFKTAEEAGEVARQARNRIFGEFAPDLDGQGATPRSDLPQRSA